MKLKKLIIYLGIIFWPLSLFISNSAEELFQYLAPIIFITISYWLYRKDNLLYPFALLIIPFVNTKLSLFPLFVSFGFLLGSKIKLNVKIPFVLLSLLVFAANLSTFRQQSIFVLDYEKKQEILREIKLYPNPLSARIFQNKARIVTDKFSTNLTALIDPGNYFFNFHPREGVVKNQNLIKFPFLTIIPVLIGILDFNKIRNYKFIIPIFFSGLLTLSLLEIFDSSDFILWLPFSAFMINGTNTLLGSKAKNWVNLFLLLLLINSTIEMIRLFYIY